MSVEWWVAMAIGVAVLGGGLYRMFFHTPPTRTRGPTRTGTRGPADLRFTCAGCGQKFTHSRRTIRTWEQGGRRFHCKACHTKRHGNSGPRPPVPR